MSYPFDPTPQSDNEWTLIRDEEKWEVIAKKRDWYPEWLWRYTHPIALIYPFRWLMTRRVK